MKTGVESLPIQHNGISWKQYQNILLPDTAPHVEVVVSKNDCRLLLEKSQAMLVRWSSHFDQAEPSPFWYVIKDNIPSMDELSSNTRSKIRRGLKRCRVRPTDAAFIAQEGYSIYRKAFSRYDTFISPSSPSKFHSDIIALADDPSWEFWGVWDIQGNLIAYSQNQIQNTTCNYSTLKFDPDHLKHYPSYALFHKMNNHYLFERKFRYVNDGARSISHITNIQTFLIEKFKFRKAYSRLHLEYAPHVGIGVRLLYPFRHLLFFKKLDFIKKISVLLEQESIRRACKT